MPKVAIAFRSAFIVTLQAGLVPLQLPLQPPKTEPAAGDAVRLTTLPGG